MSKQRVLIVDDERDIRELLTITLGRMDLEVDAAANMTDALRLLGEHAYALCFTDMRLPDGSGQDIIEHIAEHCPDTPVAMITAYGSVDTAVNALKAGAFDFVSKPIDLNMLRQLVKTALNIAQTRRDEPAVGPMIGDSPVMQRVRGMIVKLARSQAPIYISGESGVGKELVARLVHERGPRSAGPFVPVNCGAIPTELMESEFFGHTKGSFTGAHADKEGLFQSANGGTLFLDEVGELPMHMQVKLLRVIQEKKVRPVGGRSEVPVDVRILSATHKNLAHLVEIGQFRQDLFYRINVIELPVPPLRQRHEDVPALAEHIVERLAQDSGLPCPKLDSSALTALASYGFPGNVRELENMLERAMALSDGGDIDAQDLAIPPSAAMAAAERASAPAGVTAPAAVAPSAADTTVADDKVSLDDYISNVEREAIVKALEATHYNKTAAAKRLGISFRALRYKLKKLEID